MQQQPCHCASLQSLFPEEKEVPKPADIITPGMPDAIPSSWRPQAPKTALQLSRQDAEVFSHVGQPRALHSPPQKFCAAHLPCASTTLSMQMLV